MKVMPVVSPAISAQVRMTSSCADGFVLEAVRRTTGTPSELPPAGWSFPKKPVDPPPSAPDPLPPLRMNAISTQPPAAQPSAVSHTIARIVRFLDMALNLEQTLYS